MHMARPLQTETAKASIDRPTASSSNSISPMGKVLKLINSAYYGLGTQVTSLARAIIMMNSTIWAGPTRTLALFTH